MKNNPTLWLDVVVGLCSIIFMVTGFLQKRKPAGEAKARLRFMSGIAFTLTLVLGGLDRVLTQQIAPRRTGTGQVVAVRFSGWRSPVTQIGLQLPDGQVTHLTVTGTQHALVTGENVQATWFLYNDRVIRLRVLDGPNRDLSYDQGAQIAGYLWAACGVFFWFYGSRPKRQTPNGIGPATPLKQVPHHSRDERSLLGPKSRHE